MKGKVVPAVRHKLNRVILTLRDVCFTLRYLVWHEEGQGKSVIVLDSSGALSRQPDIFLLELEVLRVEHLSVIVNDDPEGLRFAVPSIVPVEFSSNRHLDLQYSASDWLMGDLDVKIGHIADKLIHLILEERWDVAGSLIKLPLVQVIHRDLKGLQPVHNIVTDVPETRHFRICVRQFANRARLSELPQDVSVW